MAQLTIIIPDTVIPRIQAAFAGMVNENGDPVIIDRPWIRNWLKERLRDAVRDYEAMEELRAKSAAVSQETW